MTSTAITAMRHPGTSFSQLVDPRIHPQNLRDCDFQTLRLFGITHVIALTDTRALPHTAPGLLKQFEYLIGRQLPRLKREGLNAWAAVGVHPDALPHRGLSYVLETLPSYLPGGKVVALGLLGLSRGGPREEELLVEQLALAERLHLPVFAATPWPHNARVARRLLTLLSEGTLPPQRILVESTDVHTVRIIRELGMYASLTRLNCKQAVAIVRHLGPERLLLSSAAGAECSDMLAVSRVTTQLMASGLSRRVAMHVARKNAAQFFQLPT